MARRLLILVGLGLVCLSSPASAQRLVVSGAVQRDAQRFTEDVVPNRLDGSAIGWTVGASTRVWRHLALAAEWSDAGAIVDTRALTLDVNGRTVTITSTLRHRTRAWSALAGYAHGVTRRVQVAYLAGATFTRVRREFRSDAGGLVLVSPSNPGGAVAPPIVDRFRSVTGGVDVSVQVTRRVLVVSGVRIQELHLAPDLDGWSARTFAGVGWAF
jgi:hypothetical protein